METLVKIFKKWFRVSYWGESKFVFAMQYEVKVNEKELFSILFLNGKENEDWFIGDLKLKSFNC